MRKALFVDTGPYLALFHNRDNNHAEAKRVWLEVRDSGRELMTTNHVLDELATLLGRRTDYSFAAQRMTEIFDSDIHIIRPGEAMEQSALTLFRKFADQRVSFTDCLSFAVMRELGLQHVFTFDEQFVYAGFVKLPERAAS